MYILDTDVCIYLLNGKAPEIVERLRIEPADQIGVTSITAGELRFGALHSKRSEKNLERAERFLAPLKQISFDNLAAIHFSLIKQTLFKQGTPIGPMDILIAATVISVDATLVTNNVREFKRVSGLNVEHWKAKP